MQLRTTAALAVILFNFYVDAGVPFPADLPDGIYIGDLSLSPNFLLIADFPANITTTLAPRTESEDRLGPPDHNRDTVCGDYGMNTKEFAITARRMTLMAEDLSKSQRLLEHNTIITLSMGTTAVYICVGEQTGPVLQGGPSKYKEWTYAWNNMDGFCGNDPLYGSKAAHFTYHGYKRVWGRANRGQKICEGVMDKNFMKWDEKTDTPWKKPIPGIDWQGVLDSNLA